GMTWAKTFKETPYGKVAVNWELTEKTMKLIVEIPVGVEAEVVLPSGVKKYRLEGKGFNVLGGKPAVALKSGLYTMTYTM
ncbi:MAG: hypothetical protein K0M50_02245, partial [Prolixibacteraceae bacterium]|nr:hypothetical protein [Prolixibacteraceae bacterium]